MKKALLTFLSIAICLAGNTQWFSQVFSDVVKVQNSNVVWCDFDYDGDLDFVINGCTGTITFGNSYGGISIIYENTGNNFVAYDTLNYYEDGALVIKDLNNDNNNDVLSTGFIPLPDFAVERHSDIYLNYSGFDFDVDLNANIDGISNGTGAAGDLDNDGDIDIIVSGRDINNVYGIRTYIKTDFGYEYFELPFATEIMTEKIEIFDVDNDGDNDIILCGNNLETSENGFKIYKNNGSLEFDLLENVISMSTTPRDFSFGDFNSDGAIDVIVTGYTSAYPDYDFETDIFINTGNLQFETSANLYLPPISLGDIAVGDINDDGLEDLLVTGMDTLGSYSTKLFIREGDFFQMLFFSMEFPPLAYGTSSFADFDNDGDLDFLICGIDAFSSYNPNTYIYENHFFGKGDKKEIEYPTNLTTSTSQDGVTFSWDPVLSTTPHTYNLCVGTTPGGTDIFSPAANLITGKMHSPGYGNVGYNTTYTIKNLDEGAYFWSVQAINTAKQSSEFAPEEVCQYLGMDNNKTQNHNIYLSANPLTETSFLQIKASTKGEKSVLIVYTSNGAMLTKKSTNDGKFMLNKNDFIKGIYFYKVIHANSMVFTGKFTVI